MSKESYLRGFCKTAEAHGVDPTVLAQFAAANPTVKQADVDLLGRANSVYDRLAAAYRNKVPLHARDVLGNLQLASTRVLNRTVPAVMDLGARTVGFAGGALTGGVEAHRKAQEQGSPAAFLHALRGAWRGGLVGSDSLSTLTKPYADKVRGFNRRIGLQNLEDTAQSHVNDIHQEVLRKAQQNPAEADDILNAHHAAKIVEPSARLAQTAAFLSPLTAGWGSTGASLHK